MITNIDHLVLTVASIEKTIDFYSNILEMEVETFGVERKCLKFGSQKINLHQKGQEIQPHARFPVSGSADICFIADENISHIKDKLIRKGILIECGPVERSGAKGRIISIYIRDPDDNLIEIGNYCLS